MSCARPPNGRGRRRRWPATPVRRSPTLRRRRPGGTDRPRRDRRPRPGACGGAGSRPHLRVPCPRSIPYVRGGVAVLLFTEVVGRGDDEERARLHFRLLTDAAGGAAASPVRSISDGLLVSFASAVDALGVARALQEAADLHDLSTGVALHVGDPITDEADYLGAPVVTVRRLCGEAEPGRI